MTKNLRVATLQFQHKANDKQYNLQVLEDLTRAAVAQGATLISAPEMCITGYWHVPDLSQDALYDLSEPLPNGPSCQRVMNLATELNVGIAAGLIERGDDGALYNSYFVALPNGELHVHRKLHAFEHDAIRCGNHYTVFDTPWGVRIGILICYDNNIVENARATALMGADILLAPHQTGGCNSLSPHAMGLIDVHLWRNRKQDPDALAREFAGPKGREWLLRWLPARARDNGMFVIFSNGVGEDHGEVRTGSAMVLDPYGRIVNETSSFEDRIVMADLDLGLLEMSQGRRWMRVRRPELYGIFAEPQADTISTREARFQKPAPHI